MSSEIVKPVTVEGIEFYCSSDGKQTGLSQVGISRLIGMSASSTGYLLTEIERLLEFANDDLLNEDTRLSAPLKNAALAISKGFVGVAYLDLTSTNQAKVVNSKLAARIIRYYAYHAPKKSEVAIFSYDKFAEIGIDNWVKEVTNFTESGDMYSLMSSMNSTLALLNCKVDDMSVQLKKTEGYRAASVQMKGLKEWMESIDKIEFDRLQLPSSQEEELFTLNEWAEMTQNGMVLSRSNKHALANIISATYKLMELESPKKVKRLNDKGQVSPAVHAYPQRHFVLINMCFSKLIATR